MVDEQVGDLRLDAEDSQSFACAEHDRLADTPVRHGRRPRGGVVRLVVSQKKQVAEHLATSSSVLPGSE
jgi:hypothetical protein